MRTVSCLLIGAVFWLMPGAILAADLSNNGPDAKRTTLTSIDLRVIERAVVKLRELRPGWEEYSITVTESETMFYVTFWQPRAASTINFVDPAIKDKSKQIIESMQILHGALEVDLDKTTLDIVRTANIR
jgi:hypothetical protein